MAARETHQIQEDLTFVRGAVERMDSQSGSIVIAVLWAVNIAVGFTINDFRPQLSVMYWPVASIACFIASLLIGRRQAREAGEVNREAMRKHAIHWGSIFVFSVCGLSIAIHHGLDGQGIGQILALVGGAGVFLGGLHLDRRFTLPGGMLVIGSAGVNYLGAYPWTIVGLLTAIALVVGAVKMRPDSE